MNTLFRSAFRFWLSMVVVCMFAGAAAAQLTGTLRDKDGEILRGTPLVLSGNDQIAGSVVPFATDPATMQAIKDRGFNTVRLCLVDPWYEVQSPWSFGTLAESLPHIDTVVANATALGMNTIINYHSVGEHHQLQNLDFAKANEYWDELAPRYKDNDRVFYEISNEPTFSQSDYLNPTFRTNYTALYQKVRTLAPDRQVLMWSFNSLDFNFEQIIAAYDADIDWDYTTIAWHMYGNTNSTQKIQDLMTQYRAMNTEWNYPGTFNYVPDNVDGFFMGSQALENIGSSWTDWHNWGDITFDNLDNLLLPDAIAKGYYWVSEPLPGDYNGDGTVDSADYTVWRDNLGATGLDAYAPGDGNGDGNVTAADYTVWREQYGTSVDDPGSLTTSIPEPSALVLAGVVSMLVSRRRSRQ
ncbi:MAG: cellulase family glycosylhydrolase [Planctomycetota bacterium]